MHYFDTFGWYTSTPIAGRATTTAPANTSETTTPGELRANFTGYEWVNLPYQEPPPYTPPAKTRDELKAERELAVAAITVTTQAGNTFDGDETSQTRMARAIIALQATGTPSTIWVLADNTAIQATAAELTEALVLAGQAQAAIWVIN